MNEQHDEHVEHQKIQTAKGGKEPRKTRGSYAYKDGDWTYEELSEHRRELLEDQRIVYAALGFDEPWMVKAEEVAVKARRLRGPFGWVRRLLGKEQK